MIEVRFHGRGGQGAVIAANILAHAAAQEGMDVQSFPFFGVERRGAPVTSYARMDSRPIRIKSQIYEPDYVVVLDPFIMRSINVLEGLKEGGTVLVNTVQPLDTIRKQIGYRTGVVDARTIATNHRLGSRTAPIVNSSMMGAFVKVSEDAGLVPLDTMMASVKELTPVKQEENAKAAKDAYEQTRIAD